MRSSINDIHNNIILISIDTIFYSNPTLETLYQEPYENTRRDFFVIYFDHLRICDFRTGEFSLQSFEHTEDNNVIGQNVGWK